MVLYTLKSRHVLRRSAFYVFEPDFHGLPDGWATVRPAGFRLLSAKLSPECRTRGIWLALVVDDVVDMCKTSCGILVHGDCSCLLE